MSDNDTPVASTDTPKKATAPAPAPAPVVEDNDEGLASLPEGAVLDTPAGLTTDAAGALSAKAALDLGTRPQPEFDDAHVGKGGSFTIDPKTGNRVPVYESFVASDGNTRYRPKP